MTAPPDFTQKAIALAGHRSSSFIFEALEALEAAYAAGAAAERAECANIVSEYAREAADAFTDGKGTFFAKMREFCNDIAHAIRARSATTKPEGK